MNKELPIFTIHVSDKEDGDLIVDFVSLVKNPAIQKDFLFFEEQKQIQRFSIEDEEEKIVTGVFMIADLPIFRMNEKFGEHFVVFTKDEIKKIVQMFFRKGFQKNVNIEHGEKVDGVFMFESIIVDRERGKLPFKGFEDVNCGSWLGSYKIDNPEIWEKVKSGEFKGFSIEGLFEYGKQQEQSPEEQLLSEFKKILSKVEH